VRRFLWRSVSLACCLAYVVLARTERERGAPIYSLANGIPSDLRIICSERQSAIIIIRYTLRLNADWGTRGWGGGSRYSKDRLHCRSAAVAPTGRLGTLSDIVDKS